MIQISERLAEVKPPATMQVNMMARKLRAKGVEVLNLSIGEPDFNTPEHIIDAAFAAARAGDTHYSPTQGTVAMREAVAQKFRTENGLDYALDEIIVSTGAKQVIFDAMGATLNPGDEVILPAPCWGTYFDIVRSTGGTPVPVTCRAEEGFLLTPEALEAAITPKTRWLFLNYPGNPSGAVMEAQHQQAIGAVLARHPDILILSDEIYEHIIFDGRRFTSFAAACPGLKDRVLTVNGVSKSYAMTGWRIGYGGGPAALLKGMIVMQAQVTSGPSSVAQAAARAALTGPQDCVEEFRKAFEARRDLVVKNLSQVPGLSLLNPAGAFYGYVGCAGLLGKRTPEGKTLETDTDVTLFLLDKARVAAVPGAAFGLSPFFRISLASSDADLAKACTQIAAAVAELG